MGTLDFILGPSAKHSPDRAGLLAEVLFQQGAVLDGGVRMQRAAGVGQLEVQLSAVVRAGHTGYESGFLQAVNNLGDGALGHGRPLPECLHAAGGVNAFGNEIEDFEFVQADVELGFEGAVDRGRGAEVRVLDAAPLLNQLAILRCCHHPILVETVNKVHVIRFPVIFLVIE